MVKVGSITNNGGITVKVNDNQPTIVLKNEIFSSSQSTLGGVGNVNEPAGEQVDGAVLVYNANTSSYVLSSGDTGPDPLPDDSGDGGTF